MFAAILAALGISMSASSQNVVRNVDVRGFEELISSDSVQVIDVRTPEEYAVGHIKGAVNVNVKDSTFREQALSKIDRSRPCAVYCRSGKRSAMAAAILSAEGIDISNLLGGIIAWEEAGKATVKE